MREKFARWGILLSQYLKRDWKKIVFWVLGLGLFCGGFGPAFAEIGKGQGLLGMYETMQNPAMISMVGPTPVKKAADYTIGAMYGQEMLLFCGLFVMIVAALHVVSHTRKEEEQGLTELVRSFQVGRQANSLAVIVETLLINILLAVLTSCLLIIFKTESITGTGALLFGASVGYAGLLGAAVALVFSQIMPTSSGASGAALSLTGLLYIIRGATDVAKVDLSMVNPMGWIYLTHPFTEDNWLPLAFGSLFCLLLVLVAFALEGRRDMGTGYLPEREGRATAPRSLLSVPGLLFKLNRGVISGWLLAFAILGAAYGSIYGDMQDFVESNELMKLMFSQNGFSIEASFTSTIMMVLIGLVAILPIAVVNKLFAEESRLRFSQIYATKVTRGQLYWTSVFLAVVAGVLGIVLAAGSLGATAVSVMTASQLTIADFLAAGYNFFPTVLFYIGLAGCMLGWLPQAGKFIYAYLGYSFMLNYFGGILDLPDWFSKTAIQSWIPRMPMEEFDGAVFGTVLGFSMVLLLLGYVGYRRRDLIEGN